MDVSVMRDLAVRLAREAGDFAVAEAGTVESMTKGAGGDVVTRVDEESERRIITAIRAAHPDHAVLGEESGWHGPAEAEYRWLVDPLDGTNNYVLGLGCYGVCITVCRGMSRWLPSCATQRGDARTLRRRIAAPPVTTTRSP